MQFNHTCSALSAAFDDANLMSAAGLVPVMRLAERAGLTHLADTHLTVPTDKGANAGLKVASLVAGMVAGADSIDDMALLRHGGMGRVFARAYAPSTLGSSLRRRRPGRIRPGTASSPAAPSVGVASRTSRRRAQGYRPPETAWDGHRRIGGSPASPVPWWGHRRWP